MEEKKPINGEMEIEEGIINNDYYDYDVKQAIEQERKEDDDEDCNIDFGTPNLHGQ